MASHPQGHLPPWITRKLFARPKTRRNMHCILRTSSYATLPEELETTLNLRYGIQFDESTLGLHEGPTDFAAHLRNMPAFLWPGPTLGSVRTFWIYFEVAFCLHTDGRILVREEDILILRAVCRDMCIAIIEDHSEVPLPSGSVVKIIIARAQAPDNSRQAMLYAFVTALWLLYAARVSPIGHTGVLQFKRRHFESLGPVAETFMATWEPPFESVSANYQEYVQNSYAGPVQSNDWDTRLWRNASLYNPWAGIGEFNFDEAARVIHLTSPSGSRIAVRMFKATYSRRGGPYTGMMGRQFTDDIRKIGLHADVVSIVKPDDVGTTLAMLDIGDGEGSSPPWIVDWVSAFEDKETGDTVIKVNLAWARHKGVTNANGANGRDRMGVPAAHMLDMVPEDELGFVGRAGSAESVARRRERALRKNAELFDWLSTTTMKLVDTKRMLRELRDLVPDRVEDFIPGCDELRYWPKEGNEKDLEPKIALACTGACRTIVKMSAYDREEQQFSTKGERTMEQLRRQVFSWSEHRVIGGEDPSLQTEQVHGVFPKVTTVVTVVVMLAGCVYLGTAIFWREVSFEDAIQSCIALLAFMLTPCFTVLHPRLYGGWSVIGSLGGQMSVNDCINMETFKVLAGRKVELKEMMSLQRNGRLARYYRIENSSFVGSPAGRVYVQYTYSVSDVETLVRFGYNLRGTLCVRTNGLHDIWKTTSFHKQKGFRIIVDNETKGFVRECGVGGNIGGHRLR